MTAAQSLTVDRPDNLSIAPTGSKLSVYILSAVVVTNHTNSLLLKAVFRLNHTVLSRTRSKFIWFL